MINTSFTALFFPAGDGVFDVSALASPPPLIPSALPGPDSPASVSPPSLVFEPSPNEDRLAAIVADTLLVVVLVVVVGGCTGAGHSLPRSLSKSARELT